MTDYEKRAFHAAAEKWGVENEVVVALEEMSELQKELCKLLRGRPDVKAIVEEIADTQIMLDSVITFLNIDSNEVERVRTSKVARLVHRINNDGPK